MNINLYSRQKNWFYLTLIPYLILQNIQPVLAEVNPWVMKDRIGRGINLTVQVNGHPRWKPLYKPSIFKDVKQAGFNSVRLWLVCTQNSGPAPNYTLSSAFWKDMDRSINQALDLGLVVMIVMSSKGTHPKFGKSGYKSLNDLNLGGPHRKQQFISWWRQIATRYQHKSENLVYELLNEPAKELNRPDAQYGTQWNRWLAEVVPVIRKIDGDRNLLIGGNRWQSPEALRKELRIPASAGSNYLGAYHIYRPTNFAIEGKAKWTGSSSQKQTIRRGLDLAQRWSLDQSEHPDGKTHPVVLTEFGSTKIKNSTSERAAYAQFIRHELSQRGHAFSYYSSVETKWPTSAQYGIYNQHKRTWIKPIRNALLKQTNASKSSLHQDFDPQISYWPVPHAILRVAFSHLSLDIIGLLKE